MASIVLRVRLTGGDHLDVTYEDPEITGVAEILDTVVTVLARDSGALRCRHGDRMVVLFGRGVASFEVSPRGPVL